MKEIKLNIGCGKKKLEGFINCDYNSEVNPDVVMDLNARWPFGDASVDHVYCNQVLEHIRDLEGFLNELQRVLKHYGTFEIITVNFYFWRLRLKYLFGNFQNSSAFYVWHCWLFKPTHIVSMLMSRRFRVKLEGKGLLPWPDLFYHRVIFKGRKAE